jgi:hypothetical protein
MPTTLCGYNDHGGYLGRDLLAQFGPTLLVDVGFDSAFDPTSGGIPNLPMKGVHALIDTGAAQSCIDSALAMQLNLPIIDQGMCSGISGPKQVNMHLAQIRISSLNANIYGSFAGVDVAAGGQPHLALIGRTFLQHVTLLYDGRTGTVSISNDPK